MSSSSSKKPLIHESVKDLSDHLQSTMPLQHFSQHHEEAILRSFALQQADFACMSFMKDLEASKIPLSKRGDLLKDICFKIEKIVEEYVQRNSNCRKDLEAFLRKEVDEICEKFRMSSEAKAIINPDMGLKSVEEFFDKGKTLAISFFDHLWNHKNGNVAVFQDQKKKLEEKLDCLKKEMLLKHKSKSDEKTRKSLKEVNSMLELSKKVRGDVETLKGKVNKNRKIFKENLQHIRNHDYDCLVGNERVLMEKYAKLHEELYEILRGTTKCFEEAETEDNGSKSVPATEPATPKVDNRNKQKRKGATVTAAPAPEPVSTQVSQDFTTRLQILQTENEPNKKKVEMAPEKSVVLETSQKASTSEEKKPDSNSQSVTTINGFHASFEAGVNAVVNGDLGARLAAKRLNHNERAVWNMNVPKVVMEAVKKYEDEEVMSLSCTPTPSTSKTSKPKQKISRKFNVFDLNVANESGDFPILAAIREGEKPEIIKEMIKAGALVNVITLDGDNDNAAHAVIDSLMDEDKPMTHEQAFAILNLLMENGFSLLNAGDSGGITPLQYAMQYEGLNEEILTWFYANGADFNSVEKEFGNSVLFHAISYLRSAEIIYKILDFGGNPRYVNKQKANALHLAAQYGHEEALEIFLEKLDVNDVNVDNITPLHLLFLREEFDYANCLKMLLGRGAQFGAKSHKGHVPLVTWIKYGKGNVFPTLKKTYPILPITEEIASAALTAIVQEIEKKEKFLPAPTSLSPLPEKNEFVQFLLFLIEEKKAKLRLKDEHIWKVQKWGKLDKVICTKNFFKELKATGRMKCKGEFVRVTAKCLGEIEYHSKSGSDSVPIEAIMACLLMCKKYQGFVEVCRFVEKFCAEPIVSKKSCNGFKN